MGPPPREMLLAPRARYASPADLISGRRIGNRQQLPGVVAEHEGRGDRATPRLPVSPRPLLAPGRGPPPNLSPELGRHDIWWIPATVMARSGCTAGRIGKCSRHVLPARWSAPSLGRRATVQGSARRSWVGIHAQLAAPLRPARIVEGAAARRTGLVAVRGKCWTPRWCRTRWDPATVTVLGVGVGERSGGRSGARGRVAWDAGQRPGVCRPGQVADRLG